MPTKSISTQQQRAYVTGGAGLQVALSPCTIFDIEGNVNSTTGTNYYIQIHGAPALISGTSVPLWSRLAVPASFSTGVNGFSFVYRPIGINTATLQFPSFVTPIMVYDTNNANSFPVYVFVSSTDNVFTSIAANTSIQVTYEDTYLDLPNQIPIGSPLADVASLQVWADPSAQHLLTQFSVANDYGRIIYLQLFGYPNPAAGAIPVQEWTLPIIMPIPVVYKFGSGLAINQGDPNYGSTIHTGCYLYASLTPGAFTDPGLAGVIIQAWYL